MLRATIPLPSVRLVALFVGLLAMLAVTVTFPGAAGAQTSRVVLPVEGKILGGGTFEGRIVNPDFRYVDTDRYEGLKVSGLLRGIVTKPDGVEETVSKEFDTKAKLTQGTEERQRACEILDLDIGRINLDLLGLVVNIAPIHINVTAVPGAGNLLGNLLCAIVGLLDPSPALADFLDELLDRLFTV